MKTPSFLVLSVALLAVSTLTAARCGGKLDVGSTASSGAPHLGSDVLGSGDGHACALLEDATVACWGRNSSGQTGIAQDQSKWISTGAIGTGWYVDPPMRVPDLPSVAQISVAGGTSCALTRAGEVYCWGGVSTFLPSVPEGHTNVPTKMPGLSDVAEVRIGRALGCARKRDGTVWCWGVNSFRNVGPSDTAPDQRPFDEVLPLTQVGGIADATGIAVSDNLSCAVHADGDVSCWGAVEIDGGANVPPSAVPQQIPGVHGVVQLALAGEDAIALLGNGTVMFWGSVGVRTLNNAPVSLTGTAPTKDSPVPRSPEGIGPIAVPGVGDVVEVAARHHGVRPQTRRQRRLLGARSRLHARLGRYGARRLRPDGARRRQREADVARRRELLRRDPRARRHLLGTGPLRAGARAVRGLAGAADGVMPMIDCAGAPT